MIATIRRLRITLAISALAGSLAASPLAHLEDPYFVQSEAAEWSGVEADGQRFIENDISREPRPAPSDIYTEKFEVPSDSLFLYVPNQIAALDLSASEHDVTVTSDTVGYWTSRVDMSNKRLAVALGSSLETSSDFALSFRFWPDELADDGTILDTAALDVSLADGALSLSFAGVGSDLVDSAEVRDNAANHIVVSIKDGAATSFLNGQAMTHPLDLSSLAALSGQIVCDHFEGKLWDLRVYSRSLSSAEALALAGLAAEQRQAADRLEDMPEYQSGVYVSLWWPTDFQNLPSETGNVLTSTQAQLDYYLRVQDMAWERNVLEVGMYPHGQLNHYMRNFAHLELELNRGIRQGFTNKFDAATPFSLSRETQYWLHENFHSFQGRLSKNYDEIRASKYLWEMSASWGADNIIPGVIDDILNMYLYDSHLTLWIDQSHLVNSTTNLPIPVDGGRANGGHQYGAYILHAFLNHHYLDARFMGDLYNDTESESDFAALYKVIQNAGYDPENLFVEFASRAVTWDMRYGDRYREVELASYQRFQGTHDAVESMDHKFTEVFTSEGTGNSWKAIRRGYEPGSWGYNAYKVEVGPRGFYQIEIDTNVGNPEYADFRARAVVYNEESGERKYYQVITDENRIDAGRYRVRDLALDFGEQLLLVVASTPSELNRPVGETFQYRYKILPQPAGACEVEISDGSGSGLFVPGETISIQADAPPQGMVFDRWTGDTQGVSDIYSASATLTVANGSIALAPSYKAATAPASSGKIKVFILAGQSNMEGKAKLDPVTNFQATHWKHAYRYEQLRNADNTEWIERDDVLIRFLGDHGKLTVGYGYSGSHEASGVELTFGHAVGNHFEEPVLIIKTAWGGRSLFRDFRSPSAGLPDASFLEAEYQDRLANNPDLTLEQHTETYGATYRQMLENIEETLQNLDTYFPELSDTPDYEFAGFVWFQGFNDMINDDYRADYTENLRHFIRDVRTDLESPELPFVIGQLGIDGETVDSAETIAFKNAQAAVLDYAEFAGNVALVKTDRFWDWEARAVYDSGWAENIDEWNKVGSDYPYHYLGSPKTYFRIGNAFANASLELLGYSAPRADAGSDQVILDTVEPGHEIVQLDARGTTAGDSPIASYRWFHDGRLIGLGPVVDYQLPIGEHAIELYVTDVHGIYSFDEIAVVIESGESNVVGDVGPLFWYDFEGEDAAAIRDVAGSGYTGTVVGGSAKRVSGKNGKALDFAAISEVTVPGAAVDDIADEISVAFWVKAAPATLNSRVFSGDRGSVEILFGQIPSTGQVYWKAGVQGSLFDRIFVNVWEPDLSEDWSHWVFTKNVKTNEMWLYFNGEAARYSSIQSLSLTGLDAFRIGNSKSGGIPFNGQLDDFMVFDKELDAEAVLKLYTEGLEIEFETDSDHDGIEDAWEVQHFSDISFVNATSNADGDPFSDFLEYQLGSDPFDAESPLAVKQTITHLDGRLVVWISELEANARYSLVRSATLGKSAEWREIGSYERSAEDEGASHAFDLDGATGFFRVFKLSSE